MQDNQNSSSTDNRFKYTVFGALFGCGFPAVATLLDIYVQQLDISIFSILHVQSIQPLHWIIDTAPFVLALFANLVGRHQDDIINQWC